MLPRSAAEGHQHERPGGQNIPLQDLRGLRDADGTWGDGINMCETINSTDIDYCPMVTPDGKYLFFTQGDDIMWVDAAIIDTYRN